jgi:RNA polymerase sigma-70 factor (ECF subfamily)
VALAEIDRNLLNRLLANKPQAWEDFVDRFMGLVVHVVNYTAQSRSMRLSNADREDLVAEVFLAIVDNDKAVLRHFRAQSSLATYLTVVARRVVVRRLLNMPISTTLDENEVATNGVYEERLADREEVERLLATLHGHEADVVRLYHLEGKTYGEISHSTGIPENSIGPTLSRARARLRRRAGATGND